MPPVDFTKYDSCCILVGDGSHNEATTGRRGDACEQRVDCVVKWIVSANGIIYALLAEV